MTSNLPITNGLIGWYRGEEWNGTSWPDRSGNGNNVTSIYGTVKSQGRFIYGRTNDYMVFPSAILPSTYTLFHVAKYNGPTRRRIFCAESAVGDGSKNWLSGFWGGRTGVAYHMDWLTQNATTIFPLSEVLISTDQKSLYRGNGTNLVINSVTGASFNLRINGQYNEWSDWAVSEVIVYNRELPISEILQVESYLETRVGEVDLNTIQTTFGGSNPVALNEYYNNSGYLPSSGTIGYNNVRNIVQLPVIGITGNKLQVYLDASDTRSYPGYGRTWYDVSGNGRHGTWANATGEYSVVDHQGTYFNTIGRACSGPPSNSFGINNTSGYTVFFVFYQHSLVNSGSFKFYGGVSRPEISRGIFVHGTWSNGYVYFDQGSCCGGDSRLGGIQLPNATGTWHSVAVVRVANSSTRYMYIDGGLVGTQTVAALDINLNSTSVDYVSDKQNYNGAWNAGIKCFLAYNRDLSSNEISALHNTLKM